MAVAGEHVQDVEIVSCCSQIKCSCERTNDVNRGWGFQSNASVIITYIGLFVTQQCPLSVTPMIFILLAFFSFR